MSMWKPYYKAFFNGPRFNVRALREYAKCWELDAMNDCNYDVGLDHWILQVESVETDSRGRKVSGERVSKIRLYKDFSDRDDANATWKWLKSDEFTVGGLIGMGFVKMN